MDRMDFAWFLCYITRRDETRRDETRRRMHDSESTVFGAHVYATKRLMEFPLEYHLEFARIAVNSEYLTYPRPTRNYIPGVLMEPSRISGSIARPANRGVPSR